MDFEAIFDDLWARLEMAGADDLAISLSQDPRPGRLRVTATVEFSTESPRVKG